MESDLKHRLKMLIQQMSNKKKGGRMTHEQFENMPDYDSTSYSGYGLYGNGLIGGAISKAKNLNNPFYDWVSKVFLGNSFLGDKITKNERDQIFDLLVEDADSQAYFENLMNTNMKITPINRKKIQTDIYNYPFKNIEPLKKIKKDMKKELKEEKKEEIKEIPKAELKNMTKEELIKLVLGRHDMRKNKQLDRLIKKKDKCIEYYKPKKGNYTKKEMEDILFVNKNCGRTIVGRNRQMKNIKNPKKESDYIKFVKNYWYAQQLLGRESQTPLGKVIPFSYKDAIKEIKEKNLYEKKGGILSLFL